MMIFVYLTLLVVSVSFAHEPIFGLGPGTIFKGGVGIETEYVKEKNVEGIATELLYGLTEDVSITFRTLQSFDAFKGMAVRVKLRTWKDYGPGRVDAFSLIGGLSKDAVSQTTYIIAGAAIGRESRRWYFFADVRTANKLYIDGAVGIRPWLTEYLKPDLVLLYELNYELDDNESFLFISPAFFFTYRNIAVKGGVQVPVSGSNGAENSDFNNRYAFSIEVHF